jgi:hypothetical protein
VCPCLAIIPSRHAAAKRGDDRLAHLAVDAPVLDDIDLTARAGFLDAKKVGAP